MEYVIKCGANYIGCDSNGKYVEYNGIANATRGPMHKMQNVINNCIAPNKRGKCKVVEYKQASITPVVKVHKPTSSSSRFDSVVEQLRKIDLTGFDEEHTHLSEKLSKIDQEITDIHHYIEFNKLNAAEGYKAFKLLQDKLLERRVIKDDMSKFQMLSTTKVADIFNGTFDKNIEALSNRTYTPRILKELFEEE